MTKRFRFIELGRLVDNDLELVLVGKHPADLIKGYVPWYEFGMHRTGSEELMGSIRFRVGITDNVVTYAGQIGYNVEPPYRGHRYAARSCRLIFPLAVAHGMEEIWITCDPKNHASRRTCEIIGAKYIETVRIPKDNEMYKEGRRSVRRYRVDLVTGKSTHCC